MSLFGKRKTLTSRYEKVLALANSAADRPRPNPWPEIQKLCWALVKDCMRCILSDPVAPVVILATAKIALRAELGAKNWHRVVAIGWTMASAIAILDERQDRTPQPGLLEAFAQDLFRNAELICYAAHQAKLPTAAAVVAEQLTSIRLGDRALKRSVLAWASESTVEDRHTMLRKVGERIDAARQPMVYDREAGLEAFHQQRIREDFADIAKVRPGARTAVSYGLSLPLEAMRVTGRSLLYIGGGLEDGVAVLFDALAVDQSARSLSGSIALPGVDVQVVEQKVRHLHMIAAARRAREVTGTELTKHIEALLAWLGESVWKPMLDQWPDLRRQPLAVVPLGEMAQLPLYTALIDDEPVCATLDVTIAPSARSLAVAGGYPTATGSVFVAADPATGEDELPYVVEEARVVAAVHDVPAVVLRETTGSSSNNRIRAAPVTMPRLDPVRDDILQRIRTSATVHLACHGLIRPSEPLDSALMLGGLLTVSTMLTEDLLPGMTIVLSACDLAGIGQRVPGEQLGFPAVLLAGGARSVVAALWPVPDTSRTVRLMTHLHEELTVIPTSRALGNAIARARNAGAPASLWASFTHFGA